MIAYTYSEYISQKNYNLDQEIVKDNTFGTEDFAYLHFSICHGLLDGRYRVVNGRWRDQIDEKTVFEFYKNVSNKIFGNKILNLDSN